MANDQNMDKTQLGNDGPNMDQYDDSLQLGEEGIDEMDPDTLGTDDFYLQGQNQQGQQGESQQQQNQQGQSQQGQSQQGQSQQGQSQQGQNQQGQNQQGQNQQGQNQQGQNQQGQNQQGQNQQQQGQDAGIEHSDPSDKQSQRSTGNNQAPGSLPLTNVKQQQGVGETLE